MRILAGACTCCDSHDRMLCVNGQHVVCTCILLLSGIGDLLRKKAQQQNETAATPSLLKSSKHYHHHVWGITTCCHASSLPLTNSHAACAALYSRICLTNKHVRTPGGCPGAHIAGPTPNRKSKSSYGILHRIPWWSRVVVLEARLQVVALHGVAVLGRCGKKESSWKILFLHVGSG